MAYTSTVPQANQTIASSQVPILNNFGFIATGLSVDHNFNATGTGTDLYHDQCQMPNQADPSALVGGTNGMYYVSGGLPKYYNGTAYFIQISPSTGTSQNILSGTVNLTGSLKTVFTLPAFSFGYYFLGPQNGSGISAQTGSAAGTVVSTGSTLQAGATSDPGINIGSSGLNFQAEGTSSASRGMYNYLVVYYTP